MEITTKFRIDRTYENAGIYKLSVYNEHGLVAETPWYYNKDNCKKWLIETYYVNIAYYQRDIERLQKQVDNYTAIIEAVEKAE